MTKKVANKYQVDNDNSEKKLEKKRKSFRDMKMHVKI